MYLCVTLSVMYITRANVGSKMCLAVDRLVTNHMLREKVKLKSQGSPVAVDPRGWG